MTTEVKIAEFKSHLSDHLRRVRQGQEIVIKDRETPIARVVPYKAPANRLVTRPPTKSLKEVDEMLDARPKKKLKLKPGELDRIIRETKMDWYDKWMASKRTSTRR